MVILLFLVATIMLYLGAMSVLGSLRRGSFH